MLLPEQRGRCWVINEAQVLGGVVSRHASGWLLEEANKHTSPKISRIITMRTRLVSALCGGTGMAFAVPAPYARVPCRGAPFVRRLVETEGENLKTHRQDGRKQKLYLETRLQFSALTMGGASRWPWWALSLIRSSTVMQTCKMKVHDERAK
jgi:hypothetical protein